MKNRWPTWAKEDPLISMLIDEIEVMLADLQSSPDAEDKITADELIRALTDLDMYKTGLYDDLFDLCVEFNEDMITKVG